MGIVEGMALFHVDTVDTHHEPGDDKHALILKLRRLRGLRLDGATIGRIRPIYHVHSTRDRPVPEYHFLIEVTAESQDALKGAFEKIETVKCHVDGFGF